MSLSELKLSEQNDISEKEIQDFLLDIQENFGENETENKKYLQKKLKEKFNINYLKHHGINEIYKNINKLGDLEVEEIKIENIFFIIDNILKLQKLSKISEKAEEKILTKAEEKIKNNIKQYLEVILENGNEANKFNEKYIYDEIQKYTGEIEESEQVEIKQTLLQSMGKESLLVALVLEINGKKVNIELLKNKNSGDIKDYFTTQADYDLVGNKLKGGNKKSRIIKKLYDNPNAGVEIKDEYNLDKEKFNLENDKEIEYENNHKEKVKKVNFDESIREQVKEGKYDEELNIFIQVTKEWNKVFKQNREELEGITDEQERKDIISRNAQKIANLFADNATLQGTMNFDNSVGFEGIKEYFEHFLGLSPTMRFAKINEIYKAENGLFVFQGDYDFKVNNGESKNKSVPANFKFYLEKNKKTGKWGIKRLKSTYGKSEDNLKEIEPKK